MKNLALLLLLLISVTACKNESDKNNVVPQVKETTMEDLSWVLGEWININDQTQSYEYWENLQTEALSHKV